MKLISLVRDSIETALQEMEAACTEEPEVDNGEDAPKAELTDAVCENESDQATPAMAPSTSIQIDLLAEVMRRIAAAPTAAAPVAAVDEKPTESDSTQENADESAEIIQRLDGLGTGQAELTRLFESRIRSDEVQSRAVDRLYEELQDARKRVQRSEMIPLLKDIIFCCDFIERQKADGGDSTGETLTLIGQMLLDILYKYDVEPFRSDDDQFDRKSQQCVETVPAESPEQDRRIASHGLCGFRLDETIVRREQVSVYRYSEQGQALDLLASQSK